MTAPTLTELVSELRELEKAATAGPWTGWSDPAMVEFDDPDVRYVVPNDTDAALIAALRNAAPTLLEAASRTAALERALGRAAEISRRLLDMAPEEEFEGAIGPEGQKESDYRIARLAEEIRDWAALPGASEREAGNE